MFAQSGEKKLWFLTCFQELFMLAKTRTISRFVSENDPRQSDIDIDTVSLSHVETVCLLTREPGQGNGEA